jgi:mono/diheme cytochrome c family protein
MPGLEQVPDENDARALAAWVAVLSPGYRIYDRYCTGCHGDDGRPPAGVEAPDRPKVVFDHAYFGHLDPKELDDAASHMVLTKKPRMPHMAAELSEGEARAVVEYLRALP